MIKFLLFPVFFFILLLMLMGFSILRTFRRLFFGSSPNEKQKQTGQTSKRSGNTQKQHTSPPTNRKKIFTKDEGEYVDYEEVN